MNWWWSLSLFIFLLDIHLIGAAHTFNINDGVYLSKGYVVDVVPTVDKAWYVSFEVKLLSNVPHWTSLINFSDRSGNAFNMPSVRMTSSSTLYICSNINRRSHCFFLQPLSVSNYTHVRIQQRQNQDSSFRFEVFINSIRRVSYINTRPETRSDVYVYRSDPSLIPANALIRNMVYGNLPNFYMAQYSEIVKTLKVVFPELDVSVDIKPFGTGSGYVFDAPGMIIYQSSTSFRICYQYYLYYFRCTSYYSFPFDQFTNVRYQQTCLKDAESVWCNGTYYYSLSINGQVKRSGINQHPELRRISRQVYAPRSSSMNVYLKNIKVITSPKGEYRPENGLVISELPHVKRQWYLSFDVKPHSLAANFSNIIQLTLGGDLGRIGDRIPGVWLLPHSTIMQICAPVNGKKNHCVKTKHIPVDIFTNVRVRQYWDIVKQAYIYRISINGETLYSIVNEQAQEFDDVLVYTSDPWYPAANVSIANLVYKNLPKGYTYSDCKDDNRTTVNQCNFKDTYRTVNGACNNLMQPSWGSAGTPLIRIVEPAYTEDGLFDTPRGFPGKNPLLPPPNAVSQKLFQVERTDNINKRSLSTLFMTFGQFLDHDISLTPHATCKQRCDTYSAWQYPCFPLLFDNENSLCTPSGRSAAICSHRAYTEPRQQRNDLSAFIDGSQIYSNDATQFQNLRLIHGGKLKFSGNNSLPFSHFQNWVSKATCSTKGGCSLAGDIRVDENIALQSMHTLWLREHNRIATEMSFLNPQWNDEKLFQTTRKIIGAVLQHITYTEYLPILTNVKKYKGYRSDVNPSVINSFATAAFRYGHSLIPGEFTQLNNNFDEIFSAVPLQEAFFNRQIINNRGIEPTMFGLIGNQSNEVDEKFTFAVARKLFLDVGHGGHVDLPALNIQRGRDHGLPPYNVYRKHCGLKPIENWSDLDDIMLSGVAEKFQEIYDTPDDIDLYAGGIAEEHEPYHEIGPTFSCIIKKQFTALRDGDRFFYKNPGVFDDAQVKAIEKVTMASILCNNLRGIVSIQPDVFHLSDCKNNRKVCSSFSKLDLTPWQEIKPSTSTVSNILSSTAQPFSTMSQFSTSTLTSSVAMTTSQFSTSTLKNSVTLTSRKLTPWHKIKPSTSTVFNILSSTAQPFSTMSQFSTSSLTSSVAMTTSSSTFPLSSVFPTQSSQTIRSTPAFSFFGDEEQKQDFHHQQTDNYLDFDLKTSNNKETKGKNGNDKFPTLSKGELLQELEEFWLHKLKQRMEKGNYQEKKTNLNNNKNENNNNNGNNNNGNNNNKNENNKNNGNNNNKNENNNNNNGNNNNNDGNSNNKNENNNKNNGNNGNNNNNNGNNNNKNENNNNINNNNYGEVFENNNNNIEGEEFEHNKDAKLNEEFRNDI